MSFISLWFPAFFLAVLIGLSLIPSVGSRHAFLLVANLVFYAAGTPWFILVLLVPSVIDYWCAIRMEESTDDRMRRQWLVLSLAVNNGVLAHFQKTNIFLGNAGAR